RSYRTVSPLPVPGEPGHRRSVLCGPIREVAPAWLSPAPLLCGAPTFLSRTAEADRPRSPEELTVGGDGTAAVRLRRRCPLRHLPAPHPRRAPRPRRRW